MQELESAEYHQLIPTGFENSQLSDSVNDYNRDDADMTTDSLNNEGGFRLPNDSPSTIESSALKSDSAPPQTQITFPEGGLVAWTNVLGSCLVCFCTFGTSQAFGAYQDFYTRIFLNDRTPSEISWIGSTQLFLLFALAPISGKLSDEGYFTPLLISSSLIYVFSQFMLSLSKPHQFYQVFLSQGIGMGMAAGMMALPAMSIVTHYFAARRALVLGISLAGSSLGGVAIPIMLNHLLNNPSDGFAWATRDLGFLVLGLLIIANLTLKTRLRKRPKSPKGNLGKLFKKLFTDIPYLLCTNGLMLVYLGLYFPFFYLQLFAILHGIDTNLAFYSITILNGASFFGRIIPNFIADYYGSLNVLAVMSVFCGFSMFLMFAAKTVSGIIVFGIIYGFLSGAIISLQVASISAFADGVQEIGIRCGITMFFEAITLLIGNPILGALLDPPRYAWHRPIIFSGIFILAGSASLVTSRMMLAKRRERWRV